MKRNSKTHVQALQLLLCLLPTLGSAHALHEESQQSSSSTQQWNSLDTPALIEQLDSLVTQSDVIGYSNSVHDARALLDLLAYKHDFANSDQYRFLKAQVLQKLHHFSEAITLLESIQASQYRGRAALALAHLYRISPDPQQKAKAKAVCARIVTLYGPDIALLCILDDTLSEQTLSKEKLDTAITQLKSMPKRTKAFTDDHEALDIWRTRLLAIALDRNNRPQRALRLIKENQQYNKTYDRLFWADLILELAQESSKPQKKTSEQLQAVMAQLKADYASDKDDTSLLLRLARVEKYLGQPPMYQTVAQQRLADQRRHNTAHPAYLAYSSFFLQEDTAKALRWAKKNTENNHDYNDLRLLRTIERSD